jgi:hypothetical protein
MQWLAENVALGAASLAPALFQNAYSLVLSKPEVLSGIPTNAVQPVGVSTVVEGLTSHRRIRISFSAVPVGSPGEAGDTVAADSEPIALMAGGEEGAPPTAACPSIALANGSISRPC